MNLFYHGTVTDAVIRLWIADGRIAAIAKVKKGVGLPFPTPSYPGYFCGAEGGIQDSF